MKPERSALHCCGFRTRRRMLHERRVTMMPKPIDANGHTNISWWCKCGKRNRTTSPIGGEHVDIPCKHCPDGVLEWLPGIGTVYSGSIGIAIRAEAEGGVKS